MPIFRNISNTQAIDTEGNACWNSRSVAVVVVPFFRCNRNTYLPLGVRADHLSEAGKWGLPCGFIDWNESARDCVRRETYEELGIDLLDYGSIPEQPSYVVTEPNPSEGDVISLRFYLCFDTKILPKLRVSDEVKKVSWVKPFHRDFCILDMAFNQKEVVQDAKKIFEE